MKVETFEQTNYNFNLLIIPGKELGLKFRYDTNSFAGENMARLASHLRKVIGQIVANPDIAVGEIEIMTGEEKQKILVDFNDTKADYPRGKNHSRVI